MRKATGRLLGTSLEQIDAAVVGGPRLREVAALEERAGMIDRVRLQAQALFEPGLQLRDRLGST